GAELQRWRDPLSGHLVSFTALVPAPARLRRARRARDPPRAERRAGTGSLGLAGRRLRPAGLLRARLRPRRDRAFRGPARDRGRWLRDHVREPGVVPQGALRRSAQRYRWRYPRLEL